MRHKLYFTICILLIIIPLVFGSILYLVYRPDTYISRFILNSMEAGNLSKARSQLIICYPVLSYLSKNYLPDCCWAFSLESCLALVLHNSERVVVSSLIISAAFLSLMETLQVTPLIPGTFDVIDISVELTAIAVAGIIINLLRKRCFYEKNN